MAKPAVRLGAVQIAFAAAMVVLVGRLGQVQLLEGARYRARAAAQRTQQVQLDARRGTIYDRAGVTLVRTQEIFHVGVARNELRDVDRDVTLIARQLGIRRRTLERELADGYAHLPGPFSGAQVHPLRVVRGVHLAGKFERFQPDPHLAQPFVGRPAAEGRPASGMERVLDSVLTGVPGSAVVLRDGSGQRYESPARLGAFPVSGADVYLTIESGLQEIVEKELADALVRYRAESGDVVVLNPTTGELLAVASRTARGERTANAFTAVFEPGSTAKPFVVAALLDRGRAALTDSIWAEQGTYEAAGRLVRDDHPSGWLSLTEVIQRSSNIGIVKFAARLTPAEQYDMLRRFGLGSPTAVEHPSESPGILWRPDRWTGFTFSSLAMGYEMAVTPLQLAQAYAAIANAGVLMRPTLVRRIIEPRGRVVYQHTPEPVRRVVPAAVAADILAVLRRVVGEGGTGETAALTTFSVAGKTGTAYRAGPGGYVPGAYTASFVSLFPADRPQIVMVVKLDSPAAAYARLTAAPLTRAVLERVLAAQSGDLDWAPLSQPPLPPRIDAARESDAPPRVLSWPPPPRDSAAARPVPDVSGSSLREAARVLHAAGLQLTINGWGPVRRTDPPAGTLVPAGSVVRVLGGAAPSAKK